MASELDNFFKDKFRLKEKIKEAEKQLQLLYDTWQTLISKLIYNRKLITNNLQNNRTMLNDNTTLFNYNGYVTSVTHIEVDLKNPKPEMICLDDIVTGLVHNNHWNGQTREEFTVAQHSVLVKELIKEHNKEYAQRNNFAQKVGLVHDAPEAYVGDLPKPFKELCGDAPKIIEHNLMQAIWHKLKMHEHSVNLPFWLHSVVKPFDKMAQLMEWEYLFEGKGTLPNFMQDKFNTPPVWSKKFAREKFISSFIELWGQEFTNKVFNPEEINEI